MKTSMIRALSLCSLALAVACSRDQRAELDTAGAKVDSAAGKVADVVRAELSVLDIDIGRKAGPDQDVPEESETFAQRDTIYASVNTTGTVRPGAITAQWLFPDGSVIDQQAQPATRDKDANLLFFLTKSGGLARGKYTFRVSVDGREVRSQDVTVR